MPKLQSLNFFLRRRILSHIIPVPSQRKRMRLRVDQQIEQLCTQPRTPARQSFSIHGPCSH